MSVREVTMFKVVCDGPDCKFETNDIGESSAWGDAGYAEEEWREADYQVATDGKHYCDSHRVPQCADCERTDVLTNDEPADSGDWWCPEHLESVPEYEAHAGVIA